MKQSFSNKRLSLITLIFIIGVVTAHSQTSDVLGGLAGSPFRMGFGARGIGMGNALTSVPFGNMNSYYNPALLPFQSVPTVLLSYGSLSLDRRLNFASYTQHLNPNAGLSIGVINAGVSNIDGRDNDGLQTQTYSTSENQFFFSFGILPEKSFALGVSAKLLYYSLFENVKSSTLGLDAGVLYSVSNEIKVAFVLQDVLSKYKWDTSKLYGELGSSYQDLFPLRKRLAVSYDSYDLGMIGSCEAEWIGAAAYVRMGAEADLFSGLQIRAGIDQISLSGSVAAKPSLGFSVQTQVATWNPRIDYAYVFEPYVTTGMHYLSLSLSFQ